MLINRIKTKPLSNLSILTNRKTMNLIELTSNLFHMEWTNLGLETCKYRLQIARLAKKF